MKAINKTKFNWQSQQGFPCCSFMRSMPSILGIVCCFSWDVLKQIGLPLCDGMAAIQIFIIFKKREIAIQQKQYFQWNNIGTIKYL